MNYKVQFQQKSLDSVQTLAEMFVLSRESQNLDRDELASELQISPFYLEALETGAYNQLPCHVYSRNFVKCYARRLGLAFAPVSKQFEHEWELFEKHQQSLFSETDCSTVTNRDLWRMPRWIRWAGAFMAITAVVGYLGTELYALRLPPDLVVYTPSEEVITDKQMIEINGKAEPEVALMINDQTILSDANGNFNELVALQPGLNIIEVSAQKKYSKQSSVYRKVIVEDRSVFSAADDNEHGA